VASLDSAGGDPLADGTERAHLREVLRDLLAAEHPPERARELDELEEFDEALYQALAAVGITSLGGDPSFGGFGDVRDQVAAIETVAGVATSMAVFLIVHYMAVQILSSHGDARQREEMLSPLIRGEVKAAFALTEADGGTDVVRAMRTRARRSDGGWRIDGSKLWISGASRSDYLFVLARTASGDERAGVDGISMFVVPRRTPGIAVRELATIGVHGLETCEVTFTEVQVEHTSLVGDEGRGFRQVLATLNRERLNVAAGALGAGVAALEAACAYGREREAFGRPIGGFQVLQHRLVDGAIALEAARGLLVRAAHIEAAGGRADLLASMAKIAASEAAIKVTEDGMQLMGGAGYSRDLPMQRWFRDVRLWAFSPLSNEMLRNYLGERMLDLPRSF
jgi:acyl-CoA dehydrogenase